MAGETVTYSWIGGTYAPPHGGLLANVELHANQADEWDQVANHMVLSLATAPVGSASMIERMTVAGGIVIGRPTGLDMGHGTLNVETAIYVDGMPIAGGGFASIDGGVY